MTCVPVYFNATYAQLLHRCMIGFVLDDNRNDLLMVSCPLPPQAEWDDLMAARIELLAARGLAPRIFLPAAPLDGTKRVPGTLLVHLAVLQNGAG